MFRSYSSTYEYFYRDHVSIANWQNLRCENNMLFSPVKISCYFPLLKISCLRAKAHLVFHWCLCDKYPLQLYTVQVARLLKNKTKTAQNNMWL